MGDDKPYKEGRGVSSGQLNRTHQAATRGSQPPNSMRLPYGTYGRERRGSSGSEVKFAKLDATLNAGSSCEASIWTGDPLADSGNNVTVNDWWLPATESLPSGTKIGITNISGKWYVFCAWVTKTIVTDVTISDGKLKKKTASIVVFWAGSDSAWSAGVDVLAASDLDEKAIVTDLQVSGTTLQKKTLTGKIYNPDDNAESGWTTWHTGAEGE